MGVRRGVIAARDGDAEGRSDALPGVFDLIAPAASAALDAAGAAGRGSTISSRPPLRRMFRAPTRFYKTGAAFTAWINGRQDRFAMVGGRQSARSILRLAEPLRLADSAGPVEDPDLAAARMRALPAVHAAA